nr:ribonuclease P protein component [Rhodococcus sp. (in: high G+C Gram-positive bacteria)]
MLPEPHRLHRSADFSRAVRRGRRMGRQDLVVHAFTRDDVSSVFSVGESRFGLIVSKAVGPAVTRHRVARRLRHICSQLLPEVPETADIVIRALPGAADLSSRDLHRQVRSGLKKLGYVNAPPTDRSPVDASRNAPS